METKRYRVADGVARVNGARVPEDRIVELTGKEALFDLALARITEEGVAAKARKGRSKGADADGEANTGTGDGAA